MKIFVTGANGTIGSSFIFGIDPAKYDIMALAKDSSDDYRLQGIEGIRIVYGDICEPSAWGEQLSGVDVVVHLAALVHLPKAKREDYLKVNYEATKKIYELSKRYEVKHFIFASTTKVYGLSKDHIEFDEEYPINFESFYSESKYYAEKYLMENHKEAINYTILRIATVYGPDDKGNINKLFSMAKKGIYISFGEARKSFMHIDSLVETLRLILLNKVTFNRVYNVADLDFYTLESIFKTFKSVIARKIFYIEIGKKYFDLPISFNSFLKKHLGFSFFIINSIEKMFFSSVVSTKKIMSDLNYTPNKSLEDGIRKYYLSDIQQGQRNV